MLHVLKYAMKHQKACKCCHCQASKLIKVTAFAKAGSTHWFSFGFITVQLLVELRVYTIENVLLLKGAKLST